MKIINTYTELDLDKHIFTNSQDPINLLIEPLAKYFGLDCFNYLKTFHDGSQIRLSNTQEWIKYYLSQQLYLLSIFEAKANKYYTKSKLLWGNIKSHQKILLNAENFGITKGITLIEPVPDGCEFYFLGTRSNDNTIIDFYLNKLHLLDKFISSFRIQGKNLLRAATKERVMSLDRLVNELSPSSLDGDRCDMIFLAELAGYYFTDRELDCIRLLLSGYSAKVIGKTLNISHRTAEVHIINIKNKLEVTDKNQLIAKLNMIF
jgi:DNA-binding CsgD family transcriptional regulator